MNHSDKDSYKHLDSDESKISSEDKDHNPSDQWPLDLTGIELSSDGMPEFPLDILPEDICTWTTSSAGCTGTPRDYIAMTLLSVVSYLLGSTRQARPNGTWTAPTFLWPVLVGPPSTGKSPAMKRVLDRVLELQNELRESHGERHAEWREASAEVEDRNRQLKVAAARGIRLPEGALPDAGPEPVSPQLLVEEATSAGLEAVLQRNPRGVLLYLDEIASLLSSNGSDANRIRRMLLNGFDASPYRREKSSEAVEIERLAIGLVGAIQPAILSKLITRSAADGLASRFLFVVGSPAELNTKAPSPDDENILRLLRRLMSLECPDPMRPHRPGDVRFSDAAVELLGKCRLAARVSEEKSGGTIGSFLGKAPGTIVRLAVTLRYLDWAHTDEAEEPAQIEIEDVERAGKLFGEYLMKHARTALFAAEQPPELRRAAALLDYIRKTGESRPTRRMLMRAGVAGLSKQDDLDDAIMRLESAGALRWTSDRTLRPQGGRPSPYFQVHPDILGKT